MPYRRLIGRRRDGKRAFSGPLPGLIQIRELEMSKLAVVLAGCGVYDGAEVNEAVLTLLSLEQQGANYQCFAPDIEQMHVINHLTGEPVPGETRNVLVGRPGSPAAMSRTWRSWMSPSSTGCWCRAVSAPPRTCAICGSRGGYGGAAGLCASPARFTRPAPHWPDLHRPGHGGRHMRPGQPVHHWQ